MISTSHFHPMLVHFPIALILIGFVAEVGSVIIKKEVCLSKTGFYLLSVGTLSALAAWLTGMFFTSEMSGSAGEIKETHELFALITVILLVAALGLRIFLKIKNKESTNLKWIALLFYGLAAVFVGLTGLYGGTLVFNYMMPL